MNTMTPVVVCSSGVCPLLFPRLEIFYSEISNIAYLTYCIINLLYL